MISAANPSFASECENEASWSFLEDGRYEARVAEVISPLCVNQQDYCTVVVTLGRDEIYFENTNSTGWPVGKPIVFKRQQDGTFGHESGQVVKVVNRRAFVLPAQETIFKKFSN